MPVRQLRRRVYENWRAFSISPIVQNVEQWRFIKQARRHQGKVISVAHVERIQFAGVGEKLGRQTSDHSRAHVAEEWREVFKSGG